MDKRNGRRRAGAVRRVMLYSHDTFGLGHLRRSRTIAQALVAADESVSALIVTGSPVAGRFDFPDRVDHVRLPGVVKLPDGGYRSHNLGLDVEETTALRAALIAAAERAFRPDLIVVDKEPWGFRNELAETLDCARARGARLVLGLRDVLDEPAALREEWARKDAFAAVERYYDEIWVYGSPLVCNPLAGLPLSDAALRRVVYTGYLRREAPVWPGRGRTPASPPAPFVLVTTGGGADGAQLIDWTLAAYEADPEIPLRAEIVYGPFLNADLRAAFERRAAALGRRIRTTSFDSRLERLLRDATGVVAMGGYNTFCEILSLDKPAVISPRTHPRQEQLIRAEAAERLGLARMLDPRRDGADPLVMAAAIRGLATQRRPSAGRIPGLLAGLETIVARAGVGEPAWEPRAEAAGDRG
jgi:predicted glycosyltransferase